MSPKFFLKGHVMQEHMTPACVPKEEAGDVSKVTWGNLVTHISSPSCSQAGLGAQHYLCCFVVTTAFISCHRGLRALLLATLSGSFLGLSLAPPSSMIRGKELSLLAVHTDLIPHRRSGNPVFPGMGVTPTLLQVQLQKQPCPRAASGLCSVTSSACPLCHPPH